jgi:hypothetical protein
MPAGTATGSTTPAATGTARSAVPGPKTLGCGAGWPKCCRYPTCTWCSRCPTA